MVGWPGLAASRKVGFGARSGRRLGGFWVMGGGIQAGGAWGKGGVFGAPVGVGNTRVMEGKGLILLMSGVGVKGMLGVWGEVIWDVSG